MVQSSFTNIIKQPISSLLLLSLFRLHLNVQRMNTPHQVHTAYSPPM